MWIKVKKHIIVYIVAPLRPAFLKRADFNKAHRSEKRGVLWLASYPVRCDWPNTSSVKWKCYALPVLWCLVPARRHKNNKTHYKWGICCIQWGHNYWWLILSFYSSHCFAPHFITWRKHYHVCISDWRIDKHQALHYTAQNSRLNHQNLYLQALSQKCQTVLGKYELTHFIETAFEQASIVGYSSRFRKYRYI